MPHSYNAFIAERISMWLLVLQSMFSVDGMWSQLPSRLRMQLKMWLVHKDLNCLGIQLKEPTYKKDVYTYISLVFLVLSGAGCLIVAMSERENTVMRARKKELGD